MILATDNVKGTVGASQSRGRGAIKIWDNEILDYRAIGPTGKEISKTFASTGEEFAHRVTILNEKEPRSWTLSAVSKDAVASQCSPPLEWCGRKDTKDGRAIGFFMSE
jgi:hypothetical protein